MVLVYLLRTSEGTQLWDAQVKRDVAKPHYIPEETAGLGMKELKSCGETRLFFRCLKDDGVGKITLIHDLRAETEPEVLGRPISAKCNSLHTLGLAFQRGFNRGYSTCLPGFSTVK